VNVPPLRPPHPVSDTGPGAAATAPRDRWYVLAVLTVVYALNIADRFSISTVLEPIRQEFRLTDTGIGLLTGWALAMFYVTVGLPVAERSGWRAAFLVLGIPGLLVALLVRLTVREPRRGQLDSGDAAGQPVSLLTALRFIARQRSAVHLILGGSVATFWSWGLMWWT